MPDTTKCYITDLAQKMMRTKGKRSRSLCGYNAQKNIWIVYSYDFGDDWEHVITVEERIDDGSGRFKLLARQGERPPEDVGGEGAILNA